MGFLDKAKKMAEQAQTKLEDVQKDFNAKQGGGQQPPAPGGAVEYDEHGRAKTATSQTPQQEPPRPHGDPLVTGEDASRHGADADRGERPATPPSTGSGLSSGDPLG